MFSITRATFVAIAIAAATIIGSVSATTTSALAREHGGHGHHGSGHHGTHRDFDADSDPSVPQLPALRLIVREVERAVAAEKAKRCLVKERLRDGTVVFKDVCTGEKASTANDDEDDDDDDEAPTPPAGKGPRAN